MAKTLVVMGFRTLKDRDERKEAIEVVEVSTEQNLTKTVAEFVERGFYIEYLDKGRRSYLRSLEDAHQFLRG
jgi:hypothetical protein